MNFFRNKDGWLATLLRLLIVAQGQTVVLIAGGIDFSVTAAIVLTSIIGTVAMNGEAGWL